MAESKVVIYLDNKITQSWERFIVWCGEDKEGLVEYTYNAEELKLKMIFNTVLDACNFHYEFGIWRMSSNNKHG